MASDQHDAHDSGFPDDIASVVAPEHRGEQAFAMTFDLRAGIAQPCDPYLGRLANPEDSPFGKPKQIKPACGDVFTKLARPHDEALRRKFVEQLGMKQMNLTQVGLRRVLTYSRTMLHRFTAVGVAFDSEPGQEADLIGAHL